MDSVVLREYPALARACTVLEKRFGRQLLHESRLKRHELATHSHVNENNNPSHTPACTSACECSRAAANMYSAGLKRIHAALSDQRVRGSLAPLQDSAIAIQAQYRGLRVRRRKRGLRVLLLQTRRALYVANSKLLQEVFAVWKGHAASSQPLAHTSHA
jgi:hypothetical protein